jgi:hypothetical protein
MQLQVTLWKDVMPTGDEAGSVLCSTHSWIESGCPMIFKALRNDFLPAFRHKPTIHFTTLYSDLVDDNVITNIILDIGRVRFAGAMCLVPFIVLDRGFYLFHGGLHSA